MDALRAVVRESQEALEGGDAKRSLELIEKALKSEEAADNARAFLLGGKAALGCDKLTRAEELLSRAAELDASLMAPLAKLVELYGRTGEQAKLAGVLERQAKLAAEKGNADKARELEFSLAAAQEAAQMHREAMATLRRLLADGLETAPPSAAEAVLRLLVQHHCADAGADLLAECLVALAQARIAAFDPEAPVQQQRMTLANALEAVLAEAQDATVARRLCDRAVAVCAARPDVPEARSAWVMAASALLALQLEQQSADGELVQGTLTALEAAPAVLETEQLRWRAWACVAANLLAQGALAEARRASDLATTHMRHARELAEQARAAGAEQEAANEAQNKAKKKKKKVFVFGAAPANDEDDDGAGDDEAGAADQLARRKALRTVLAHKACRFWRERAWLFMRCFSQGSPGRDKDLLAAEQFTSEGLAAVDAMAELGWLKEAAASHKIPLAVAALEATSGLAPLNGDKAARTALDRLDGLCSRDNARPGEHQLALGAYFTWAEGDFEAAAQWLAKAAETDSVARPAAALRAWCACQQASVAEQASQWAAQAMAPPPPPPPVAAALPAEMVALMGAAPRTSLVTPWYVCVRGCALLAQGALEQAQTILLKAAQLDRDMTHAFAALGDLYTRKGEPDKALKCLQRAAALDPKAERVVRQLVALYQDRGQSSLGDALFRRTVAAVDELAHRGCRVRAFAPAKHAALVGLARGLHQQGRFADAAAHFQKVIDDNPEHAPAWQGLGDAYRRMGRCTAAARAFLSAHEAFTAAGAAAAPAEHAYCLLRRGQLLSLAHEHAAAAEALELARGLHASPVTDWTLADVQLSLARQLARARRFTSAAAAAGRALELLETVRGEPLYSVEALRCDAFSFLATALPASALAAMPAHEPAGRPGLETAARRAAARAVHLQPWDQVARMQAARHAVAHGQNEALDAVNAGDTLPRAGDARRLAEICVALDPADAPAWNLLGVAYTFLLVGAAQDGERAEARRFLDLAQHCFVRATQLNEDLGDAWANLAALMELHGEREPAVELLVQAQASGADAAAVWTMRARLSETDTKARAALDCAVQAAGEGPRAPPGIKASYESARLAFEGRTDCAGPQELVRLQQLLERYLSRCERDARAHLMLATVLGARGNSRGRAEALRAAEALEPGLATLELIATGADLPVPETADDASRLRAARCLVSGGRLKEAQELLLGTADQNSPAWLACAYSAFEGDERAQIVARLAAGGAESVDDENGRVAAVEAVVAAALRLGNVSHATQLEPLVRSAPVRVSIAVGAAGSATALRAALALAPWSAEANVSVAERALAFGQADGLAMQVALAAAARAGELAEQAGDVDTRLRAARVEALVLQARQQVPELLHLAHQLCRAWPWHREARRLLAFACVLGEREGSARAAFVMLERLLQQEEKGDADLLDRCSLAEAALLLDDEARAKAKDLLAAGLGDGSAGERSVALACLGRLCFRMGDTQGGSARFQEALALQPDSALLWIELGHELWRATGPTEAAAFCFSSAVACTAEDNETGELPSLACSTRVEQALFVAQTAGARRCLGAIGKVAKAWPSCAAVQLVRGWLVLLTQNNNKERKTGVGCLRKVLEREPHNALAQKLLEEADPEPEQD